MFIGFSVSTCGYFQNTLFKILSMILPLWIFVLYPSLNPNFLRVFLSCLWLAFLSCSSLFNQAQKPVISCIILTSPVKCLFSSLFPGCWYLFLEDCKFICLMFPLQLPSLRVWGWMLFCVCESPFCILYSITLHLTYTLFFTMRRMCHKVHNKGFFQQCWFPWLHIPFLNLLYPTFNWILAPYMKLQKICYSF